MHGICGGRIIAVTQTVDIGIEVSFEIFADMLDYILDIRWYEIPYHIAIAAIAIAIAYCTAMFFVSYPVSVWEHFTKKKVNEEKEAKFIKLVSVLLSVLLIYSLLYEKVR